ncbi:polyamine ABC transporter substrate-binding protein [Rhodoferax sp.]|uniref:polyamine ABC transporter substrate-binding protein n=1 Tax=Rhodoferax sp. TaxID=50421 RepID=UPI00283C9B0A|nr:polyamine ABC transporter substrate-binding protein [Rhodoferax sp.]MDR3369953.1 polyamine ABC transporter substrate-binding protein [Rhodoferax sp.]
MRDFIKRIKVSGLAASLLATGLLVGGVTSVHADDENVLNIYNWSDYIGENTIANFEKETGIKVRYDTFDSNETLHAKLVAGKTGYDIVVPSSNWAKIQIDGGLFTKLDKSKITTYGNLDPFVMKQLATMDAGNQHIVPWMWGITTIGINEGKLKAALGNLPMPDNAWDLLFKPEYAAKAKSCGISVLDSGDEVFPAALRYLGKPPYSKNPADYQAAGKLLAAIRPNISLFSSSGYINDLASGSLCLVLGWNGDISIAAARAKEAKNGNDIKVLLPKTGAVMFFDTMAIPVDAKHVDNAYKFISYIYRPEVNADMVNKVLYANPIPGSAKFIKPEVRDNKTVFMSPEDLARMVPPEAVSSDTRRLRTRLYTTFKTGL